MDNIWDKVVKQYPNIQSVLDNLYKQQLNLLEAMDKLDTEYPVEGYTWECDPNSIGKGVNPWYLKSVKVTKEQISRTDEQLKKQLICVNGTHHFKEIGGLCWCKYCGTIKDGDKFIYPEQPHFLPKHD